MWQYKEIYNPEHPDSRPNGCVLEHRVVAETILGRKLTNIEIVHHIDEDRTNNNPENLWVFRSQSDHSRYHMTGLYLHHEDNTYSSPIAVKNCKFCGANTTNKLFCSIKCTQLGLRTVERPSEEELKDLVLNNSLVELGKRFGVSDNAIKKWCKFYGFNPSEYRKLHKNSPKH